ncbi:MULTISPECIES: hypothetical protein [unclassified Rathayibacter]|uniref:hypothetical protein n=1 Tax=unclassified Rathayibacter TaxID=2609250 RepID=UPI00188B0895|nr:MULTISPECIES: hypothetical protein [unclassified Rathayibacter]MBF4462664.1 hypothetical protein [Rathayibacter sp. VKM Ac-2879]MBF4504078.1 hypothetical protein [Rathayibacter sp. VKM Ac-2878]
MKKSHIMSTQVSGLVVAALLFSGCATSDLPGDQQSVDLSEISKEIDTLSGISVSSISTVPTSALERGTRIRVAATVDSPLSIDAITALTDYGETVAAGNDTILQITVSDGTSLIDLSTDEQSNITRFQLVSELEGIHSGPIWIRSPWQVSPFASDSDNQALNILTQLSLKDFSSDLPAILLGKVQKRDFLNASLTLTDGELSTYSDTDHPRDAHQALLAISSPIEMTDLSCLGTLSATSSVSGFFLTIPPTAKTSDDGRFISSDPETASNFATSAECAPLLTNVPLIPVRK